MNAKQARDITETALNDLAAALEQGKSAALTQYLQALGRFHDYSFGNVMLIMTQKPEATRVAGFHAWRKLGRFVKKGEKGIVIIAPMRIKPKATESSDDDEIMLRFKAVYVFDITQTDGEELPTITRVCGNPREFTERLKELIAAKSIVLEYADDLGGAHGQSAGGHIKMLNGLSAAEEFSVLTHELAHELLHRGERRASLSKTVRETEAEAVAFVVNQAIGLAGAVTAAADYIQLYDGEAKTLAESLDHIQKAAAEIIATIAAEELVEQ